jgi:hypothetical protein
MKEILAQATGLTPADLSIIFYMKQRQLSLEQINQDTGVGLQVLKQFLTDAQETTPIQIDPLCNQNRTAPETGRMLGINERAVLAHSHEGKTYVSETSERAPIYFRRPPTTTEKTKKRQPTQTLPKPQHIPTFLYCCQRHTNQLHRVNLLTGEQSCHKVPNYQFKEGCRWSELPGGSLLITGGSSGTEEVVKIDTLREYAVSSLPPMHTSRSFHAAVYHSLYVYVLGYRECERYSCAESRWEVLPALPVAGSYMSAVEVENSLYALGGRNGRPLDTVQKLSLDSLTWKFMQLKLPQTTSWFACFKSETEVYLVIKETLYSFTPLQVKPIKTVAEGIRCFSSYYRRGTLYYEGGRGIGRLALRL